MESEEEGMKRGEGGKEGGKGGDVRKSGVGKAQRALTISLHSRSSKCGSHSSFINSTCKPVRSEISQVPPEKL